MFLKRFAVFDLIQFISLMKWEEDVNKISLHQ